MSKTLRETSILLWTTVVVCLIFKVTTVPVLHAQSQSSSPAATQSPAPAPQPMTLALTPLGQKSIENIQLRFQLLQRDLRDLQTQECDAHSLKQEGCRLDAERGVLIYAPPVSSTTLSKPATIQEGSFPAAPKSNEAAKPAAQKK